VHEAKNSSKLPSFGLGSTASCSALRRTDVTPAVVGLILPVGLPLTISEPQ